MTLLDVVVRMAATGPTFLAGTAVVGIALWYRRGAPGTAWSVVGLTLAFMFAFGLSRILEGLVVYERSVALGVVLSPAQYTHSRLSWALSVPTVPLFVIGCGIAAYQMRTRKGQWT